MDIFQNYMYTSCAKIKEPTTTILISGYLGEQKKGGGNYLFTLEGRKEIENHLDSEEGEVVSTAGIMSQDYLSIRITHNKLLLQLFF